MQYFRTLGRFTILLALISIMFHMRVAGASEMSSGWRHNYQRELVVRPYGSATQPVYYVDASGNYWRALGADTGLHTLVGKSGARLTWIAADETWTLQDGSKQEVFSKDGRLERIIENNRVTTLDYDTDTGLLLSVTSHSGRQLLFEYVGNLLSAVVRPDGERILYDYEQTPPPLNSAEPGFRLARVRYPDGTSRIYHYELEDLPHHLTGITDENGERFSTFMYDSAGQVTGSEHAGGVERVSIDRRPDGTTVVTDPLGKQSTYRYSPVHNYRKLASVEGGPCATCTNIDQARTYDSNGYVKTRTGFDGVVTEYQRDYFGHEISRIEAKGTPQQRTIQTQWHATLGQPTLITEPDRTTTYTYDTDGNRLTETVTDTATGAARTTLWTYNALGFVETIDGPRTDVTDITAYNYDSFGNLTTVTNALGHVTRYTAYDAHGNPLSIVDPNGITTELEYNLRQRLIRRTVALGTATAATTLFDYDLAGQLEKTTLADGSWIGYEYDAARRVTAIHDNTGNRIDYALDAMGNRIEERINGPDGATFRETFRTYNTLNRLVVQSGAEGSRIEYGYDLEGHRTSITDANGSTTLNRYDALDRLFETVDALAGITSYTYDVADNLVEVIDPRNVTTDYVYNGFNELVETRSPDAGTTTYTYDEAGNRVSQTDARGITVAYTYDALNRLTLIDYPGTEQDITYTYDALPNAIGRLVAIDDETGRTEYAYDARGNLTHKTAQVHGAWLPVAYGHDTADRLKDVIYPDSLHVFYPRDAAGRVTGLQLVNPDGTGTALVSDMAYAPFGPVTALTFGNGITETRTYDREGRLAGIDNGSAMALGYAWDATGNITGITDNHDSARSQTFDYDALYRLTHASGNYGTFDWTHDAVGNRLSQTVVPAQAGTQETTTYTYAAESNRLTAVATLEGTADYTYDPNGNITDNGEHAFTYDARNRLVNADGVNAYAHNALGQRVLKQTPVIVPPGAGEPDDDILERIAELEAQANAVRTQASGERQAADTAYATAALHQQQADSHTANARQNRLEAELNWAAYAENLADIQQAQAEIVELQADIANLQDDLIDPALTPEDDVHNAPLLAEIADEQQDIAEDQADAEEDRQDALDDEADAEQAGALAAQAQALVNQYTAEGNTHLAAAEQLEQQADSLQAEADALRNSTPSEPQGGTILFAYDEAGHLLGEYDETGNPIRQYVWLGHRPVVMLVPDAGSDSGYAIYYIHADHLNTPKVVTEQGQQIVWKADYEPFGEAEPTVTTLDMPLRFPGQIFDSETNLHYNYFRTYDPSIGRYVQSDPIGLAGGLNTYEYAASRPTIVYDASGLSPQCSCHVTCTSAPVTGLVFCTKTKICKGPCEEETTERRYGWYLWENKNFSFVSYYRCSDFPGALPNDPNIAPGLPPNPRSPFEQTRI